MSRPDRSPRLILALGALATVAALFVAPAHAGDRLDENGKPCPTETVQPRGLAPLTFCSPALDRAKVGEAAPEFRSYGGRSGSVRSVVIKHGRHGEVSTTFRYYK